MKMLLQKAFGICVVLFFGFLAYVALNLIMFSANRVPLYPSTQSFVSFS